MQLQGGKQCLLSLGISAKVIEGSAEVGVFIKQAGSAFDGLLKLFGGLLVVSVVVVEDPQSVISGIVFGIELDRFLIGSDRLGRHLELVVDLGDAPEGDYVLRITIEHATVIFQRLFILACGLLQQACSQTHSWRIRTEALRGFQIAAGIIENPWLIGLFEFS